MIRLLIIGKDSVQRGQALFDIAPLLTIDNSRLPAAGIRCFKEKLPDAICLLAASPLSRNLSLIREVRSLPMGEIVPIIVILDEILSKEDIDETKQALEEFDVFAVLTNEATPEMLLSTIEEAFDFSPGELSVRQLGEANSVVVTLQTQETSRATYDASDDGYDPPPFRSNAEFERDATRVAMHSSASLMGKKPPVRVETASYTIEQLVDSDGNVVVPPPMAIPKQEPPPFPPAQPKSAVSKLPSIPAMKGPVDADAIRDMLLIVHKQPYHDILGLKPNDIRQDPDLIAEVYTYLSLRFDPKHIDVKYSREYYDQLEEIRDALEDAYSVLNCPELREPYFTALNL